MIKFGTSGFRAIISEDFTKENIQKIAQSLAKIIKSKKGKKTVIVGYDRRFMSQESATWFAEVLAGNGIITKLYSKAVPSPTVMYGVMAEDLDYGVIITASHNPYYYNGIKICTKGGADASNEVVSEIEKLANSNLKIKALDISEARDKKLIEDYDNIKDYFKHINKFVSKNLKENKLKVLFNAMHGACAEYAEMLAKMFKISKFTLINETEDPYFERKLPCPEEDKLDDFKKQVVRGRYTIGVATDGDGDRLGVVDENGEFHDNNELMALAYYFLVKYRGMKGDAVKNNSTSSLINKVAEHFGFKCHETAVGFKYISAKMKEVDALLGGESSGGMTVRNYIPSKDSFFSISIILDALATIKKPLGQIIKDIKEECGYISTCVSGAVKVKNRKKMQKAISKKTPSFSYKPVEKNTIDGTKFIFEDGSWALLRFSGTENVLRYYMEFSTEIECERNLKAITNFIAHYGK